MNSISICGQDEISLLTEPTLGHLLDHLTNVAAEGWYHVLRITTSHRHRADDRELIYTLRVYSKNIQKYR